MINCYDSYIVMVHRKELSGQTCVEGLIEIVGVDGVQKSFSTMEEMWAIIGASERKSRPQQDESLDDPHQPA